MTLKMKTVTLEFYEADAVVLEKKFGDQWPTFVRDIINQHTTPYGADRRLVLDDLAAEYAKLSRWSR